MAAPTYTGNSAGNVIASCSLGAGANTSSSALDYSTKFEAQIHITNTPGGSVSSTRGLQVDVYREYGSTPTQGESPFATYVLPSQTASTAESFDFWLGPGKYLIKLTNLDGSNAITVSVTADTVDAIS